VSDERVEIIPSVLSADFAYLGRDAAVVAAAGIETIQVDVMDGHFVPNITVGPPVVRALDAATDLRLDVHLMIESPEDWVDEFVDAGADIITVHAEATNHLHRVLQQIRARGVLAGAAINPATPVAALETVLPLLHVALVMTVDPGFGGQSFIAACLPKIERLRGSILASGSAAKIQVDGGIDAQTIGPAVQAGARQCVAGSSVFGSDTSVPDALERLRAAASAALQAG